MNRSRSLRQRLRKWRSRSRRRAKRRHRRSIHQRSRHGLPHRSLLPCRNVLLRIQRDRLNLLLPSQPSKQAAQQSCALRLPVLTCRCFGQLASPACLRLSLLPLAAVVLGGNGGICTLPASPPHPALPQRLHKREPHRRPLPRRVEGKRRRQIQRQRHHQPHHDARPRQVQILNHEVRQQPPGSAFNRQCVPPHHVSRQQGNRRRPEHHPHSQTYALGQRRPRRS